ncbi:uncharacterized protein EKO05_0003315 [Ascochyta rabiei]|uniref:uncharacterized protein n=1 Tax=Didymella rabiei TaxID=5454 RepID=UPI0019008E2D|nr:uncharacterized protein EKO05_0003315 [Ascochyta rabiei]UPX12777.1 hypothetical protein EKO05_0003315 [Ascochyta rabiei]
MSKAPTNCWTCKQRKIGCDRALPTCLNCDKSQRTCQGYGLRLAWPDKQDGRRKQKRYEVMSQEVIAKYLPRSNGSLEFLNTVVQDLDGSRMSVQDLMKGELISIVANAIPTSRSLFPINEPDGMLLNHYDLEIARMTTTIDDDSNGFRLALIPMALSSSDFSAQSILHSTLAVSCYHLGRPQEALQHKIRAIKNLSDSFASFCIDTVDSATKIRHFAASMMLCVYGVFDESDTAWHVHLQGARSVYNTIPAAVKSAAGFLFLKPWFQYHYIFSQYTYSVQNPSPEIIGVLGCSTEVLHLISCINHLRGLIRTSALSCTEKSSPNFCKGFLEIFPEIEQRLLHLQQDLLIHPGSTSGTINNTRIAFTAELYRIAAVLYFYQTVPAAFIPACNAQELVRNGLNILWEMKVCSSPWPLFILACTVTGDEDRIRILDLIETSGSSRRIGNYSIIIGLVRAVWKRQDLCTDDKEKRRVDWRDLIEKGGYMPSFI